MYPINLQALYKEGAALIASANGSITMANKRGDKGHPCLVPLCTDKLSDLRITIQDLDPSNIIIPRANFIQTVE